MIPVTRVVVMRRRTPGMYAVGLALTCSGGGYLFVGWSISRLIWILAWIVVLTTVLLKLVGRRWRMAALMLIPLM